MSWADGRDAIASSCRAAVAMAMTIAGPTVRAVLDELDRQHPGIRARICDDGGAVRKFMAVTPVGFQIALAGFEGIELSRRLGNVSGGLPFTLVFDRNDRLLHRHIGETTYEQLAAWAQGLSGS